MNTFALVTARTVQVPFTPSPPETSEIVTLLPTAKPWLAAVIEITAEPAVRAAAVTDLPTFAAAEAVVMGILL